MNQRFLASSVGLFLLLACASGCAKGESAAVSSRSSSVSAPPAVAASAAPIAMTPGGGAAKPMAEVRARAITVTTSLRVANVDSASRSLREAAERVGGYVADAQVSGTQSSRTARLDLKVPAQELRRFLATLSDAGETASYAETAEDVTEQMTDLAARLHNARAQEKRMLEIMASKTASLSETFEVERELGRMREQIERLDAQQRNLGARVDYVTVHISLDMSTPPPPPELAAWQTPGKSISEAAWGGARASATFFTFLVMAIVAIAPTVIPLALPLLALFYAIRNRRRKNEAAILTAGNGH